MKRLVLLVDQQTPGPGERGLGFAESGRDGEEIGQAGEGDLKLPIVRGLIASGGPEEIDEALCSRAGPGNHPAASEDGRGAGGCALGR